MPTIDHARLDKAIGDLLDRYKTNAVAKDVAINAIAHVIEAVARGNEQELLTLIGSIEGA